MGFLLDSLIPNYLSGILTGSYVFSWILDVSYGFLMGNCRIRMASYGFIKIHWIPTIISFYLRIPWHGVVDLLKDSYGIRIRISRGITKDCHALGQGFTPELRRSLPCPEA